MSKKIFKVLIELYDLVFTSRKDDRIGRVITTGTVKISDLIELAQSRRSDISPQIMRAVYDTLRDLAIEQVCEAKTVEFGLGHNRLGCNGVFIGDRPTWDGREHSLSLLATAAADVREAIKNIVPEVLGMAQSGMFINLLTDVTSGEVNARITPGGGVNMSGVKIKVIGDAPEVGIHLTEINTGTVTAIPATSILVNDPSKVTFIVPANLPTGDYKLSVTTQYLPNSVMLKEARTYVFDYVLACN
jgi:hypothetical protein